MGPELKNAVKAVKWATDYLLKVTAVPNVVYVQLGDAYSDHNCWERPEDMDTLRTVYKIDGSHPGSDVAGETAAALAAASIVFRSRDPAYSRLLLSRAVRVRHFLARLLFACPFFDSGYMKSGLLIFHFLLNLLSIPDFSLLGEVKSKAIFIIGSRAASLLLLFCICVFEIIPWFSH